MQLFTTNEFSMRMHGPACGNQRSLNHGFHSSVCVLILVGQVDHLVDDHLCARIMRWMIICVPASCGGHTVTTFGCMIKILLFLAIRN